MTLGTRLTELRYHVFFQQQKNGADPAKENFVQV